MRHRYVNHNKTSNNFKAFLLAYSEINVGKSSAKIAILESGSIAYNNELEH